jgi:hypothetical protein
MRKRELPSDPAQEAGRRHISIVTWVSAVALSFALGSFVTHFALLQEPISQFSFQAFFMSPFWSIASTALVCFVLGIGFAYVPFSWYREDANRALRTQYRDLRSKADALRDRAKEFRERTEAPRAPQSARAAKPVESSPEPEYAESDEGPQDIAAVISEMSAAIKANLRDTGPARPVDVDLRQALRSTSSGD